MPDLGIVNKLEKRYNQEISLLGERLRKLREQKKLTQLDMEINSGINRTEISRIENGQKNIEFLTLVKLAIALDAELEDFFYNHKA
ncbi:MAG: helix-turn-helix transcriptional regulator [Niabella sp.]|nr:helix-turn-helix transcriptional regulator [Niabella sp.]